MVFERKSRSVFGHLAAVCAARFVRKIAAIFNVQNREKERESLSILTCKVFSLSAETFRRFAYRRDASKLYLFASAPNGGLTL